MSSKDLLEVYCAQRGIYEEFWRCIMQCQVIAYLHAPPKFARSGSRARPNTPPVLPGAAIFAAQGRAPEEPRHRRGAARKFCWAPLPLCPALKHDATYEAVLLLRLKLEEPSCDHLEIRCAQWHEPTHSHTWKDWPTYILALSSGAQWPPNVEFT